MACLEHFSRDGCLVKVAFPIDGNSRVEIIWDGLCRQLHGGGSAGTLENDPVDMPGLSADDEVRFSTDMIRDWSLPDGDARANRHFTARVIAATTIEPGFAERIAHVSSETTVPAD